MNLRSVKTFSCVSFLCAALLSGCNGATPVPGSLQTEMHGSVLNQTGTPTNQTENNTEIIEPENVSRLSIIDEWGQGTVYGVDLSPDGDTIALATAAGVYLYDVKTLEQKQFINLPTIRTTDRDFPPSGVVSFSPDGSFLAVGYDSITIWDLQKNGLYRGFDHRIDDFNVVQIAFSPQGSTIVVMSMGLYGPCDAWGGNLALYDIPSGVILNNEYFCPESALFHFTFTDNGRVVFAGATRDPSPWSYKISIVDTKTGEMLKTLNFSDQVFSVSADGSQVAVKNPSTGITEIVDMDTLKILDNIKGSVFFLPDGQRQIMATDAGWAITTSNHKVVCEFNIKPQLTLDVYRSTFKLTEDNLIFWNRLNQSVEIWNTSNCQLSTQMPFPTIGFDSYNFNARRNLLATNDRNNIHLHNGVTGNYEFSIPGNFNFITTPSQFYDFSADGHTIMVASNTNPYTISFWDTTSGKEIKSILTTLENIKYVSINPKGDIVATVDSDGIHLWDVPNGTLLTHIPERFGKIYFNPAGGNFALVGYNKITIRNDHTGEIEKTINFEKERFDIVFSNDWEYLALVMDDKIELWDMDGNRIRNFMEYPAIRERLDLPKGYSSKIGLDSRYEDIKFSPNNRILAAIRYDYENYYLRFWDTNTGEVIRDVLIPFIIYKLEFSPNGEKIYLLGDGIIHVMGLSQSK